MIKHILKGSPQWSIDRDGIITIGTTWMCYRDTSGDDTKNAVLGWLKFQEEVAEFAGKPGDKYKLPTAGDTDVEATEYTETDTFLVQEVNYTAVEGRTHYEVTFTNVQNLGVMARIGEIESSVNENNERTKTARYRAYLGSTITLDELMLESGTVTDWAGTPYLIESSEYTAEGPRMYTITITAKEMTSMMIGLPTESKDSFGNSTVSVVWRYARDVYEGMDKPVQGTDAADYIGGLQGYIIQSVEAQPHGVLGYHVSITAVSQREHTRISSSRRDILDTKTGGYYTEWESNFQASQPEIESLTGQPFKSIDVKSLLPEGVEFSGNVRDINFTERITGSYDVNVRMSNQREDAQKDDYADDWNAQVSQHEFVLTEEQAGWGKTPSGELFELNDPPTTRFTYTQSPSSLVEMMTASAQVTIDEAEKKVLAAIKNRGTIGYDKISGVQGFIGDSIKWLSPTEIAAIQDLKKVQTIMLEGFVHAQPTIHTKKGGSVRNLVFRGWTMKKCPLLIDVDKADEWPQINGRDQCVGVAYRNYKWQYHEINVTLHYKKHIKQALVADNSKYYKDAIKKVACSNYTSYKGCGISFTSTRHADENGDIDDYTEVTCSIHALLTTNAWGATWNPLYDRSVVIDQSSR